MTGSRRRRRWALVAVVLTTALSGCGGEAPADTRYTLQTVIDGDEFTAVPADGGPVVRVKLLGALAPDLGRCHGPESRAYAEEILRAWSADLRLRYDPGQPRTDALGRTQAYAINGSNQLSFAVGSVEFGHARAEAGPGPPLEQRSALDDAQRTAQRLRSGLWDTPCRGRDVLPPVAAPTTSSTSATPTPTSSTPATTRTPAGDVDRPFVPAPRTHIPAPRTRAPAAPSRNSGGDGAGHTGHSGHQCLSGERDGDHDGYCGEGR